MLKAAGAAAGELGGGSPTHGASRWSAWRSRCRNGSVPGRKGERESRCERCSLMCLLVSLLWYGLLYVIPLWFEGAGAAAALVSRGARRMAGRAALKPAVLALQQVLVAPCSDVMVWHGVPYRCGRAEEAM